MRKIVWVLITLVMVLSLLFGAFSCAKPAPAPTASATPTPTATISLKASHGYATTYQMNVYHEFWKEAVEKYTGGRVKVTIYPMGQLVKAPEDINALSAGSIDFATPGLTYIVPTFSALRMVETAFLFENREHKIRFFTAAKNKLTQMYAEKGIKYLGETEFSGFAAWNNKRPITKVEDWKGLKFRTASTQKDFVEALGGSGITIAPAEAVMALQQGMVDGYLGTASLVVSSQLTPYLKYGTSPGNYVFWGSVPQLMSMQTWNKLPPDIQNIIETKVAPEVWQRSQEFLVKGEADDYAKAGAAGIKYDWFQPGEIDKMKAIFQPIVTKQLDEWGSLAKEFYQLVEKTR